MKLDTYIGGIKRGKKTGVKDISSLFQHVYPLIEISI